MYSTCPCRCWQANDLKPSQNLRKTMPQLICKFIRTLWFRSRTQPNASGWVREFLSGGEGLRPSREKGESMRENAPKPYRRLDKADRIAIERGLDKRKSCRQMARELAARLRRSPTRWRATARCAAARTRAAAPRRPPTTPARSCCRGRAAATGAGSAGTTALGNGGASTRPPGRRRSPTPSCANPGWASTGARRSSSEPWS